MTVDDQLAQLVEQTGRLRMLSHRAVMFASFGETGDCRVAVETFQAILTRLTGCARASHAASARDDEMASLERSTCEALANSGALDADLLAPLTDFVAAANALCDAPDLDRAGDAHRLADIVAGPLLQTLNRLNACVRAALDEQHEGSRRREAGMARTVEQTLAELTQISGAMRLVSLNALIEARHVGTSGAGFGVVASEIRRLSQQASDSVKTLRGELGVAGGG